MCTITQRPYPCRDENRNTLTVSLPLKSATVTINQPLLLPLFSSLPLSLPQTLKHKTISKKSKNYNIKYNNNYCYLTIIIIFIIISNHHFPFTCLPPLLSNPPCLLPPAADGHHGTPKNTDHELGWPR